MLARPAQVEQKTVQGLLQLIEAERRSDTVNRLLLQHLLRMLTALGIYENAFQARGQDTWMRMVVVRAAIGCVILLQMPGTYHASIWEPSVSRVGRARAKLDCRKPALCTYDLRATGT